MNTIQRVNDLIQERNLSLNKLATLSGTKYSTLQMTIKPGGQLSIDMIERICTGLNISLFSFISVPEVTAMSESTKFVAEKPLTFDEIKELRLLLAERHKKMKAMLNIFMMIAKMARVLTSDSVALMLETEQSKKCIA